MKKGGVKTEGWMGERKPKQHERGRAAARAVAYRLGALNQRALSLE